MKRITLILTIFLLGCGTTSKVPKTSFIRENNLDVLILSTLVQDYLKQSNGQDFNLHELIEKDTSRRISNCFEQTELKNHGGHISVYYRRIKPCSAKIELTDKEKERFKWIRWSSGKIKGSYDGEIRLDFGERFYRIKRIVVNKKNAQ